MGFLGVLLEALGIFWGVEFCPLSLEIREGGGGHQKFVLYALNLHISHINTPCSPPPPPDKILHKYCHQFLWRWLQYTQDEGKAKAL